MFLQNFTKKIIIFCYKNVTEILQAEIMKKI